MFRVSQSQQFNYIIQNINSSHHVSVDPQFIHFISHISVCLYQPLSHFHSSSMLHFTTFCFYEFDCFFRFHLLSVCTLLCLYFISVWKMLQVSSMCIQMDTFTFSWLNNFYCIGVFSTSHRLCNPCRLWHAGLPCPSFICGFIKFMSTLSQWGQSSISSSVGPSPHKLQSFFFSPSGLFNVRSALWLGGQVRRWHRSFSVEILGLISFRISWFLLLSRTLKVFSNTPGGKH